MDHSLDDSLTMESIDNMDFDHSGVVVNQEDITLEDNSQADDIPMDLDTIEEQPLLETGNEEVIVSDFIGDQFGFQEYSVQGENSSGANITIETNLTEQQTTQNDQIIDVQLADSASIATTSQTNVITIKTVAQPPRPVKKVGPPAKYPFRQVAIAPKPTKGAPKVHYAIAPKPMAFMVNKSGSLSKAVPMKSVVQGALKGNTVLAQIGKQLVMVPASAAGSKIKLASLLPASTTSTTKTTSNNMQLAQLISNKTKFVIQGSNPSEVSSQPAVISKLVPLTTAGKTRYVMQQKTVPFSMAGNKLPQNVVLTTPPKHGAKGGAKKQVIAIKSQSPKVATSQGNVTTKKVLITSNPNQSLILKAAGSKTGTQVAKETNVQGQRTQLHPINVPGKGIQFIKLVTNQPAVQKTTAKSPLAVNAKNFVLTDAKGNIIQMSAEKGATSQPPPLIVTGTTTSTNTKLTTKGKKLVRIAPVGHKGETSASKQSVRSSQSLLVPFDPTPLDTSATPRLVSGASFSLEEFNEMVDQNNMNNFGILSGEESAEQQAQDSPAELRPLHDAEPAEQGDVKPTLASLLSDTVSFAGESIDEMASIQEVEIEYESTPHKLEYLEDGNSNSMDDAMSNQRQDENLIIVPAGAADHSSHDEVMYPEDTSRGDDSKYMSSLKADDEANSYASSKTPNNSDSVMALDGLSEAGALRARKPCNCTKSQCLKLYCDCFANGEFCNQCNCNNCHNNLRNEELRQKAIRACLERNPNAFRPKIGKAKSGGPEIIRRHNKGCHCKRSGCLKNYCECYEAKIACTLMCKCVGCRNIQETLERRRDAVRFRDKLSDSAYRAPLPMGQVKQPCSFMTPEVIEAVAQCMVASVSEGDERGEGADPVEDILLEFSRCMADIISASHREL